MLQLSHRQMASLAHACQEQFLDRLSRQLEEVASQLYPARNLSFSCPSRRAMLRQLLDKVIAGGLCQERNAATAIEYFVLYGVDAHSLDTARILGDPALGASRKLDALWSLRTGSQQ